MVGISQILMAIGTLILAQPSIAKTIDPNSPIFWNGTIVNGGPSKLLSGAELDPILESGIKNEKLKLECKFNFEKDFTQKRVIDGVKYGGEYEESLGITCTLNGVLVKVDHPIHCEKGKSFDMDGGGLSFLNGESQVSFSFLCSAKKK